MQWCRSLLVLVASTVLLGEPLRADGTQDCPNQLTGLGLATVMTATQARSCTALPAPGRGTAVLVDVAISGASCGRCLQVSGPKGRREVQIVGVIQASGGRDPGDLLLDTASLEALGAGPKVSVSWVSIPCSTAEGITLDLSRPESRPAGLKVRASGYRTGLASIVIRRAAGDLSLVAEPDHTFSTQAPVGSGPWHLVLTDVHGRVIEAPSIALGSNQSTNIQFPACTKVFADGFEGGDLSSWGRTGP